MMKKYREIDFFDKNENIYAFFTYADNIKNMHSHEFWEIVYLFEGRGVHRTPDGETVMEAGDFLLIRPGAAHSIESVPQCDGALARICNCLVRRDYFSSIADSFQAESSLKGYALCDLLSGACPFCLHLKDDNASNIRHLLWLIAHEYNHFTDGSEVIMSHALSCLLICVTRLYEYQSGKTATPVSRRGDMDELIKFMTANFGQPMSLQYLALHAHLSREYLSRAFKKHTGKNISAYLTEIRIARAKDMLRTNTFSIEYIGEYCGYQSASAFQKAFKKTVGMSPGSYRRSSTSSTTACSNTS